MQFNNKKIRFVLTYNIQKLNIIIVQQNFIVKYFILNGECHPEQNIALPHSKIRDSVTKLRELINNEPIGTFILIK